MTIKSFMNSHRWLIFLASVGIMCVFVFAYKPIQIRYNIYMLIHFPGKGEVESAYRAEKLTTFGSDAIAPVIDVASEVGCLERGSAYFPYILKDIGNEAKASVEMALSAAESPTKFFNLSIVYLRGFEDYEGYRKAVRKYATSLPRADARSSYGKARSDILNVEVRKVKNDSLDVIVDEQISEEFIDKSHQ